MPPSILASRWTLDGAKGIKVGLDWPQDLWPSLFNLHLDKVGNGIAWATLRLEPEHLDGVRV